MKMVAILFSAIGIGSMMIWVILRMVNWVWVRPRKLDKWFRKQGLKGHPYRTLYGDTKEMAEMTKEAKSKPIKLTDDILPRVLPFHHHTLEKYGNNCFAWIGPEPRIFIMEPELIKEIVMNNTIFKKPKPAPLVQLLVSGISSYEDDKWAKHRKILNTAFYTDKLKYMVPAMHKSCEDMINQWEILLSQNKCCELDVQPYLEDLTSDVISRTAFGSSYAEGTRIFHLQRELAELTRQAFQSVYIPGWRFLPTRTNRRMKSIDDELRDILWKMVNKRERAMKIGEASEEDLLGILLSSNLKEMNEHGSKCGMTTDEVIEECKVFYFAGQESSSNLLVWTMVLLSVHQTWQARARQEVQQVFGQNKKPDFEGLNRLKIVTMILNEVLRLYPPAPYFIRKVNQETKLGKMSIPPDVILMIPTIFVHHNQELWGDDVKEFKPERFADGVAKATKNRLCFLPFSWGPRICIGNNFAMMETKIALAMILQRFDFKLSPSYTHAPTYVVTLRPQCGAHLSLRKL